MSRRRLARNAAFSVVQVVLSAVAMVLMYRLLMQSLPIEAIGLWSLVVGSASVARLTELGLGAGALRFIAADIGAERPDRAAGIAGMAGFCVAALVGVLALISRPFLYHYLELATPAAMHGAVSPLLDAALASVVLGAIANVIFSAIDGCQRMDLRAQVQIAASFVQLGATWLVLPRYGLAGLGLAALAQAGFQLVFGAGIALRLLGTPLRSYVAFDLGRLKQLFLYGGGLQISGLAQLLFEPLIKVLLTGFSGLALTGYFDMANRIMQQLRGVIVAAYGALVPHIAARTGRGDLTPAQIRSIYSEACDLLLFIALPYFTGIAAALPLALTLWAGHFDAVFLAVALVQFGAWLVNVMITPAYLLFVALGRLRWNIASHVLIGAVTLVFGIGMGKLTGGPGVLAAGAGGLIVGSLVVLIAFHREYQQSFGVFFLRRRLPLAVLLLVSTVISVTIAMAGVTPNWPFLVGQPIAFGLAALALSWRDPQRAELTAELWLLLRRS